MTVELWVKALYPFEYQQNESNGQFWAAFSFQAAAGGIAAAKSGVGGAAAGCMFWDTCKVGQHALLDSLFHRNPIKIDENWGYCIPILGNLHVSAWQEQDRATCGSNAASKKMLLKEPHKSHYGLHYGHKMTSGCFVLVVA